MTPRKKNYVQNQQEMTLRERRPIPKRHLDCFVVTQWVIRCALFKGLVASYLMVLNWEKARYGKLDLGISLFSILFFLM